MKKDVLKGRIHCEIFLSEHFMNYSFRVILWNMKYFHEMLLLKYPTFIVYLQKQPPEVFCKKFHKIHRKKNLYQSLFFNKVAGLRKTPGTGVLLWILWNFQEHLSHRATLGDCFCMFLINKKLCLQRKDIE